MAQQFLTDKTLYAGTLADGDLLHVVDVSDTSQNPAGSSYKLDLLQLKTFIGTHPAIAANVIPAGTGTTVSNGTWEFDGNNIIPTADGSNIGKTGTNRVGTIFMASTINYAADMIFSEAGSEKMRILTGGNVGIGTPTPSATLDLVGTFQYVDTNEGAGKVLTSDASGNATWQTPGADTSIYTADGSLTGNRIVTQGANTLAFTGSAVNAFSIDGTTFSVDATNNRIGIGTAAPTADLHISKTAAANTFLQETTTVTADGVSHTLQSGGSSSLINLNAGHLGTATTFNAQINFRHAGAGAALIETNSANTAFLIQALGGRNVNIRNTTASNQINVHDNGEIYYTAVKMGFNKNFPTARYEFVGAGTGVNQLFALHDSTGSSNNIVALDNGKVGIGASPVRRLDVFGTNENAFRVTGNGFAFGYLAYIGNTGANGSALFVQGGTDTGQPALNVAGNGYHAIQGSATGSRIGVLGTTTGTNAGVVGTHTAAAGFGVIGGSSFNGGTAIKAQILARSRGLFINLETGLADTEALVSDFSTGTQTENGTKVLNLFKRSPNGGFGYTNDLVQINDNGNATLNTGNILKVIKNSVDVLTIDKDENSHFGGSGAASVAKLEVTSTTKGFRVTPMTAAQAAAITPIEGLMLFTSDTDATFTSIGYWAYENGAWNKL